MFRAMPVGSLAQLLSRRKRVKREESKSPPLYPIGYTDAVLN